MSDPWMKFYPTDWRSDPALKMCSLAARGLWIEMIAVMHEATPYGHLVVSGRSPTDMQLAVLAGAPPEQISGLIGELDSAGVFSRTKEGVIYSRKMTRAAKKAAIARKNGKNGGNPRLRKTTENKPLDNQIPTNKDKPQKPEARSQKDTEAIASVVHPPGKHDVCITHFNAVAARVGWPQVQRITPTRRAALSQRISDIGGEEAWRDAIDRAALSPLLTGQAGRGWRADFDWLCKAANFTKLMEGNYDPRDRHVDAGTAHQRGSRGPHDAMVAAFAHVASRDAH